MSYSTLPQLIGEGDCSLRFILFKVEQPPFHGMGFVINAKSIGVEGTLDEVWFERESLLSLLAQLEYLEQGAGALATLNSLSPEECFIEIARDDENAMPFKNLFTVHFKIKRVNYILDSLYENRVEGYFGIDKQSLLHFMTLMGDLLQEIPL